MRSCLALSLALLLCSCAGLPKAPKVSMCSFSQPEQEFLCLNHVDVRYSIKAQSPSADKMVAMPYKDFLEMQGYWSKVFQLFEREYLGKVRK